MKSRQAIVMILFVLVVLAGDLMLSFAGSVGHRFEALAWTLLQTTPNIPDVSWLFTPEARMYIIILALAVFAGTTIGVATKHIEAGNLRPEIGDLWYYVLGFGIGVWFLLNQVDPVTTFGTTTILKTGLASAQNYYKWRSKQEAQPSGSAPAPSGSSAIGARHG